MSEGNGRRVTVAELNAKLDKFRWEMRALILMAIVAGKFIPLEEAAQAAIFWR